MPYQRVNDLQLYYEDLGMGDPILFLHGHYSRGILAFGGQIQPFQGKYRCLFPDFRGHGRTTCESLQWNARQIADDMAAFLEALEISRVHLFGYSCGGIVGLYFAAKYPEKVRSLVAVGAGTMPMTAGSEDYLPDSMLRNGQWETIHTMETRHRDAHKGNWQAFLEQTVLDWRSNPSLTDEEWRSIVCPAFFINGEHDPFGSCKDLKEKCPQAKTYEVKGGGHRPHFVMEQGKEINALVLDFLKEMDPHT